MSKEPVLRRLGSRNDFDVDQFIEKGIPLVDGASENALDSSRRLVRERVASVTVQPKQDLAPAHSQKVRKVTASYKHNEANYLRLKRMSQRLSASGEPRTMGDMIDEALELIFPKWKAEIESLPPEPEL